MTYENLREEKDKLEELLERALQEAEIIKAENRVLESRLTEKQMRVNEYMNKMLCFKKLIGRIYWRSAQ